MRDEFASALVSRGLVVDWGDAPWVLVRKRGLRGALARHGVIVRDCGSFGWPDMFRLATPRAEQLSRVLEAIDRVLETENER
jgi:histidinol-phosphate/aromatic aminotransferase/cobyric acid decarboxylase-like protein